MDWDSFIKANGTDKMASAAHDFIAMLNNLYKEALEVFEDPEKSMQIALALMKMIMDQAASLTKKEEEK